MTIEVTDRDGSKFNVDNIISECPHCRKRVSFELLRVEKTDKTKDRYPIYAFIQKCRDVECGFIITSYYCYCNVNYPAYQHIRTVPKQQYQTKEFSEIIKNISINFVSLYNQSLKAEHEDCPDIAGVGYRKALEFLVKDYLIKLNPQKEKEIKKSFLSACIQTYIGYEKIKNIAQRAAWLGNDETHYERLWEEKDMQDLKYLISLLISYIELEIGSDNIITEMQDKPH
ncbi:MAG: hypothetical protein LBL00_08750 [Endomicrobium sp.]|jgi:hypothetical protein|nr:hypothetical protein [Endomicrobium sp.]